MERRQAKRDEKRDRLAQLGKSSLPPYKYFYVKYIKEGFGHFFFYNFFFFLSYFNPRKVIGLGSAACYFVH